MPRKKRKRRADDYRYWEAEILGSELHYQFSAKMPDRYEPSAHYSELLVLEVRSRLTQPVDWRGVALDLWLSGDRILEAQLLRHEMPPTASHKPLLDPPESLGHLHPVLKTRIPERLHLYTKLPADRLFSVATAIESKLFKALDISTIGPAVADQKAHRVGNLSFKAAIEPDEP